MDDLDHSNEKRVHHEPISNTFDMDGSSGNGSDNGSDEGNSAQDDHDAYDDQAHDLAVEFPIVEFAEHIVESCDPPFL
jgi:hypothetical protein